MKLNYTYKELPTRKFKRINLTTGKTDIVTITNKNNFTIQQQLKLLNLNSSEYYYSEIKQGI